MSPGPRQRLREMAGVVAATLLVGCSALVVVPNGTASPTPAPENATAQITPSTVQKGERVTVSTNGWAPMTQLQAVVCGDNAVGGSVACDLPSAVTTLSDSKGRAVHTFDVQKPPRPCPCVVRVSTFTAPALAMNVPFTLVGHRVGTPPEEEIASSDLRVDDVDMRGHGGLRALLGLGGSSTMVITLANRGDASAAAPDISYGFGRGAVSPTETISPDVMVGPGARKEVEVEVTVPLLAFGSHQGVAQWADGTGSVASGSFTVFPVGALLVLVSAFLFVVISDLRRSRDDDEPGPGVGAHRFLDDDGAYLLPDVVYLEDIGGYLVKPSVLKNSRVTEKLTGRVTVHDLAQLLEGDNQAYFPDGTPAAPPPTGAGGLSFFVRGERRRPSNGGFGSGPGLSFFLRGDRAERGEPGRHSGGSMGSGSGLSFFVRRDRDRDL